MKTYKDSLLCLILFFLIPLATFSSDLKDQSAQLQITSKIPVELDPSCGDEFFEKYALKQKCYIEASSSACYYLGSTSLTSAVGAGYAGQVLE